MNWGNPAVLAESVQKIFFYNEVAILQFHGVGLFDMKYIDAKNDPRNRNK